MRRWISRAFVVLLCGAVCASTAAISPWSRSGFVRTEDLNGDGRPDLWRTYDRQGQLTEIAVDTNFDGRSDVREYYDQGALVRRETDRNFDGRVDLIESFDRTTHERVRSVADVDYDGRADLLVLFHDGHAVFSKWAAPVTLATVARRADGHALLSTAAAADLGSMDDPFRADLTVDGVRPTRGPEDSGALPVFGVMPVPRVEGVSPPLPSPHISTSDHSLPSSAEAGPRSPRGPPASPLFS
jgi:hypothetical protein